MLYYLFLSFIPFLVIIAIMTLNYIVKLTSSITELKLKLLDIEKSISLIKRNGYEDAIEVIRFYSTLKIERAHEVRADGKHKKIGSMAQDFLDKNDL